MTAEVVRANATDELAVFKRLDCTIFIALTAADQKEQSFHDKKRKQWRRELIKNNYELRIVHDVLRSSEDLSTQGLDQNTKIASAMAEVHRDIDNGGQQGVHGPHTI